MWRLVLIFLLSITKAYAMVPVIDVPFSAGVAWFSPTNQAPVITIKLHFPYGSSQDPAGKEGLAELTAQLLMEGAGSMDADAFNEALQENAIRLDVSAERDGLDVTVYTLTETLGQAVDMTRLLLTQPRLHEKDLERIKKRQLSYLAYEKQTPASVAGKALWQQALADHPYATPTGGTEESIQAITRNDIKQFAANALTLGGLRVGASGDVTPQTLATHLDMLLEGLPAGQTDTPHTPATLTPAVKRIVMDVPQTTIMVMFPGISRQDPGFYPWVLADSIMGGSGFSSRLMENLREKQGLTYGIASGLSLNVLGNFWIIQMSTRNDKAGQAWQAIQAELARAAETGFTDQELQTAKDYENGAFALQLDSTRKLAGILISMQIQGLGQDYLKNRPAFLDAVSLDALNTTAKTLFNPQNFTAVFVGNPQGDGLPSFKE